MTPTEARQLKPNDRVRYRKNGHRLGWVTEAAPGVVWILWDDYKVEVFRLDEMGAIHRVEETTACQP